VYALFKDVSPQERQRLRDSFFGADVATEGTRNRPGRPELGGRLSLITRGTITVLYNPEPRGAPIRLAILEQGDFVGELSTFFGVMTATLETRTGVRLAHLNDTSENGDRRQEILADTLRRLIEMCPQVGFNMVGEMCWRLLRTNRYLTSSAPDRLRYTIALREIERAGGLASVSDHPDIPSRADLAVESGITERSVGRALDALQEDRIIERRGHWYSVLSWQELTRGPLTRDSRPLYL
jgi:CRP-like cAMP-binding protein